MFFLPKFAQIGVESETAEAKSISTKLALIFYSERRPLLPKYANQATKSVFFSSVKS